MSVSIDLDDPNAIHTNYGLISGRVNLFVKTTVKLFTVHVKLEGESLSQLARYSNPVTGGPATETHKILYQCQRLFPESCPGILSTLSSTLRAGRHEFNFNFQIPLDTDCHDPQQKLPDMGSGNFGLANIRKSGQYNHVKQILPPSLTSLPGLAEISYYVKVTVRYSSIFRDSLRSVTYFRFSPLTPASIMWSRNCFKTTRIPFKFQEKIPLKSNKWKNDGQNITNLTPMGELFIHSPQPAHVICSKKVPLVLMLRKLNKCSKHLLLVSFTMHLISRVKVKVDGEVRTDSSTWVVANLNGLSIEIGSANDDEGTECILNQALWSRFPIPDSIGPSFQTCNISRSYELDIRVGLGFRTIKNEPQIITLPLRLPVEIFSGITSSSLTRDCIGSLANNFVEPQSLATLDNDGPPPSYEKAVAMPQ
ncbi:putative e set [Erysiphe neolycopersici]|uniref:Putative e set n=1 Tax=Erysiphe neolycopersici TaxID=212602 RepID=A0A420HTI3_9PEZI|nr:putative e set [Erysiphe neolycopersici]